MKYDSADCKITEEENALSALADKRRTQEKWVDGMMSEGDWLSVVKITLWSFLSVYQSHDCYLQSVAICSKSKAS